MMEKIRSGSLSEAKRLGYPTQENLPLLDDPDHPKGLLDIERRLLALYAVVSCSYGLSKETAKAWLKQEGLLDALSDREIDFLKSLSTDDQDNEKQWQVEALWTLAWAIGCHDTMDFSDSCADNFVQMLPDIKSAASADTFQEGLRRRTDAELLEKSDLAYCLHWAIRDAELNGKPVPGSVPKKVVEERRRALEWMLGEIPWDDVILDT